MPARARRHGPAFWGTRPRCWGEQGLGVCPALAPEAWTHQRCPTLGQDHQLLWSLESGSGSEVWGPLGEDPIWQGTSPEKAGHAPHPTGHGSGWWQRDVPPGALCVVHTEGRMQRDGAPERQRRAAVTLGVDQEGCRAGEDVKRRSSAAAVINAPGVFTNTPAQACVEAGLGEGGCVLPGPPGARLHPQRGHCLREALNPHSSPESGP